MKRIVLCALLLLLAFLAMPYFIVRVSRPHDGAMIEPVLVVPITSSRADLINLVYTQPLELCEFERYIIGVVAAEVPALFHMEALRAQAVAARTYAIYTMSALGIDEFDYERIGEIWQAYLTEADMRARWGDNFDMHFGTISEAVISTRGEIIVHNGEPVLAVFHAFSGGMTEYSENVWSAPRPYLRSVNSDFYMYRNDFEYISEFSSNTFLSLLRAEFPNIALEGSNIASQITINERSNAGYVLSITIGNKTMEGTHLRRILGLRSTNFIVRGEHDKIVFNVRGHGHGAGMSQVGANALAHSGYNYIDILKHYYSGVQIGMLSTIVN